LDLKEMKVHKVDKELLEPQARKVSQVLQTVQRVNKVFRDLRVFLVLLDRKVFQV
jgi:hypothetical protein